VKFVNALVLHVNELENKLKKLETLTAVEQ
jgi:hypothetical protein